MKIFSQKSSAEASVDFEVMLNYFDRQKSRIQVTASNGEDVGILIPRGQPLSCGDVLTSDCGLSLKILGLPEEVSVIEADGTDLACASYHLGNRHIPVAIDEGELCYHTDHVIDDMMIQLGFVVSPGLRVFHPEKGAYHKRA